MFTGMPYLYDNVVPVVAAVQSVRAGRRQQGGRQAAGRVAQLHADGNGAVHTVWGGVR